MGTRDQLSCADICLWNPPRRWTDVQWRCRNFCVSPTTIMRWGLKLHCFMRVRSHCSGCSKPLDYSKMVLFICLIRQQRSIPSYHRALGRDGDQFCRQDIINDRIPACLQNHKTGVGPKGHNLRLGKNLFCHMLLHNRYTPINSVRGQTENYLGWRWYCVLCYVWSDSSCKWPAREKSNRKSLQNCPRSSLPRLQEFSRGARNDS